MKYGELNLGQVEAIVNKLGGMDGTLRFLRGELVISEPTRSWHEEDGVIYFSVTSDGTTGQQWTECLDVSKHTRSVLLSDKFVPTSGVTTHIAVLKGTLFTDSDRITEKIRAEAGKRKFETPSAEVACLIRKKFTNEDLKAMGLSWIVTMHKPINNSDGDPHLLAMNRNDNDRRLRASYDNPSDRWYSNSGFAFAVPQV